MTQPGKHPYQHSCGGDEKAEGRERMTYHRDHRVGVEVVSVEENVKELGANAAVGEEEGDCVVGAQDEVSLLERVLCLVVARDAVDVEPMTEDVDGDEHDEGELPVWIEVRKHEEEPTSGDAVSHHV
jgi:hypothetical protein